LHSRARFPRTGLRRILTSVFSPKYEFHLEELETFRRKEIEALKEQEAGEAEEREEGEEGMAKKVKSE